MESNSAFDKFEMQLTDTAKEFLREVGKWAYFLSIIGYVYLGLMTILAFVVGVTGNSALMNPGGGEAVGSMSAVVMMILFLIIIAITFFPVYYLNKFSVNLKKAFRENSTEYLTNSFEYLKSHYKFVGIFTLIVLSIYALLFIVGIVAALTVSGGA